MCTECTPIIRRLHNGAKKHPFYRIVVADSRRARNGAIIEQIGRYNPNVDPSMIELDLEKVDAWVAKGAQPTDTVARLINTARAGK